MQRVNFCCIIENSLIYHPHLIHYHLHLPHLPPLIKQFSFWCPLRSNNKELNYNHLMHHFLLQSKAHNYQTRSHHYVKTTSLSTPTHVIIAKPRNSTKIHATSSSPRSNTTSLIIKAIQLPSSSCSSFFFDRKFFSFSFPLFFVTWNQPKSLPHPHTSLLPSRDTCTPPFWL